MTNRFTTVRRYKSASSDRWYAVKINLVTLQLSCNCPGWTFKRDGKARGCKHITRLQSERIAA